MENHDKWYFYTSIVGYWDALHHTGFSVFYSLTKFSERFHFLALSWWKRVY